MCCEVLVFAVLLLAIAVSNDTLLAYLGSAVYWLGWFGIPVVILLVMSLLLYDFLEREPTNQPHQDAADEHNRAFSQKFRHFAVRFTVYLDILLHLDTPNEAQANATYGTDDT